ncbi:MAG: hypothetical protein IM473_21035 [Microcystis sp. M015S2]|nr:hypothetical protein [Microcystis sp. M015S2]MCA2761089.1 hypothetical protein [Microcystis sp. M145S2]
MQPHNDLLDIAAFLSVIEPKAKQKFASIKLEHDQILGRAIASLRKQHQLRQSDIIGVSELTGGQAS